MGSRLILAAGVLICACFLFLTLEARAGWSFILAFRGMKLVAMLTVGVAVAVSTLLLQTLSANRILTPSIMGFDALFLLMQSMLVFTFGAGGFSQLDPLWTFTSETAIMTLSAMLLFSFVLGDARDIAKLLLTGLIIGVMLRSLTSLVNRLIDPSEYAVLQGASYASFTSVPDHLVWLGAAITAAVTVWAMSRHHALDVLALGRDHAVALGLDHRAFVRALLLAISLLVAVSTALVGPVMFFGLLVSALTYALAGSWRHAVLLPFAAVTAGILLVSGQALFEHVFALQSSVAVVIEGLGGLVFLFTLLMRPAR